VSKVHIKLYQNSSSGSQVEISDVQPDKFGHSYRASNSSVYKYKVTQFELLKSDVKTYAIGNAHCESWRPLERSARRWQVIVKV